MDASCKIQRSIHDVRLTYKYVSRILGTYQARGGYFLCPIWITRRMTATSNKQNWNNSEYVIMAKNPPSWGQNAYRFCFPMLWRQYNRFRHDAQEQVFLSDAKIPVWKTPIRLHRLPQTHLADKYMVFFFHFRLIKCFSIHIVYLLSILFTTIRYCIC